MYRRNSPQGQFAVAIKLDDPDQAKFPIGTQGRAAIYANSGSWFVPLAQDHAARLLVVQLDLPILRLMRSPRPSAAADQLRHCFTGCALAPAPVK
jgi:hypothetical protein